MKADIVRSYRVLLAIVLLAMLAGGPIPGQAQRMRPGQDNIPQSSENGWHITPHGTLKVLMLFVEVEYDVNQDDDPDPSGTEGWRPGQLPHYADRVFDHEVLGVPRGEITRYYDICSLGNFRVLGDYWNETITVKESAAGRLNLYSIKREVSAYLAQFDSMRTAHGSHIDDFDRWRGDTGLGKPRVNSSDEPHSLDHVMMFLRNYHGLPPANGSASGGSYPTVSGYGSDSYSQFNGRRDLPAYILRHELNHMLLGGNNFHCCGGGSPAHTKLFIPGMYGWGLMGAANAALPICNAWDRYRLGWKQPGKSHLIGALNAAGTAERDGDLDVGNPGQEGRYLLRDFATTGDAIRIRLPFIDSTRFQQYLWIENHQGYARNGVEFDRYRYAEKPGFEDVEPGLLMFVQVDREQKEGRLIFGGYSNYLRPVLADGHYDIQWRGDSLLMYESSKRMAGVHYKPKQFANPLTGSQDMEAISYNKNPEDSTLEVHDMVDPNIEEGRDGQINYLTKFGYPRHAFRLEGNHRIGMGTNPASANVLTFVSGSSIPRNQNPQNNRIVHLNGIAVEIIEERPDGSVLVDVRFNDTAVSGDIRWCAPQIELNDIPRAPVDLHVKSGTRLLIDHGETPTRRTNPTLRDGQKVFTSPTTLTLKSGTTTLLERKSELVVDHCSQVVVEPGARLVIEKGARIKLKGGAMMSFAAGAVLEGNRRAIKARNGQVHYDAEVR